MVAADEVVEAAVEGEEIEVEEVEEVEGVVSEEIEVVVLEEVIEGEEEEEVVVLEEVTEGEEEVVLTVEEVVVPHLKSSTRNSVDLRKDSSNFILQDPNKSSKRSAI